LHRLVKQSARKIDLESVRSCFSFSLRRRWNSPDHTTLGWSNGTMQDPVRRRSGKRSLVAAWLRLQQENMCQAAAARETIRWQQLFGNACGGSPSSRLLSATRGEGGEDAQLYTGRAWESKTEPVLPRFEDMYCATPRSVPGWGRLFQSSYQNKAHRGGGRRRVLVVGNHGRVGVPRHTPRRGGTSVETWRWRPAP
jgi:hypothetical protein